MKDESKGYYEYNRESPEYIMIDERENAIDSLETCLSYLIREDNLKWKWIVFALHHSLYSFCVSALVNGNYSNVLQHDSNDSNYYMRVGNGPIKKSKTVPFFIKTYKTPAYRIDWDIVDAFPEVKNNSKPKAHKKEKLITFWSALARVQDNYYWMRRYVNTKAVIITDNELEMICWMSEKVRNDLTHFIPKGYSIGVLGIIETAEIILRIIESLVFESHSILFMNYDQSQRRVREAIGEMRAKLSAEKAKIMELISKDEDQQNS